MDLWFLCKCNCYILCRKYIYTFKSLKIAIILFRSYFHIYIWVFINDFWIVIRIVLLQHLICLNWLRLSQSGFNYRNKWQSLVEMLIWQCSHFLCANWKLIFNRWNLPVCKEGTQGLKTLLYLSENILIWYHTCYFFLACALLINYLLQLQKKTQRVVHFTEDAFWY